MVTQLKTYSHEKRGKMCPICWQVVYFFINIPLWQIFSAGITLQDFGGVLEIRPLLHLAAKSHSCTCFINFIIISQNRSSTRQCRVLQPLMQCHVSDFNTIHFTRATLHCPRYRVSEGLHDVNNGDDWMVRREPRVCSLQVFGPTEGSAFSLSEACPTCATGPRFRAKGQCRHTVNQKSTFIVVHIRPKAHLNNSFSLSAHGHGSVIVFNPPPVSPHTSKSCLLF